MDSPVSASWRISVPLWTRFTTGIVWFWRPVTPRLDRLGLDPAEHARIVAQFAVFVPQPIDTEWAQEALITAERASNSRRRAACGMMLQTLRNRRIRMVEHDVVAVAVRPS